MENRLPKLQRFALIIVGLFAFLNVATAQVDLTFEYSGPDTIFVGNDCTAPLDWGAPSSVDFVCNTAGCVIQSFSLLFISDGYVENDPVAGGEEVFLTYNVEYTINGSAGDLSVTFSIHFIDIIGPVFDPLTLPPSDNFGCLASVPPVVDPTASDNCPAPGGGSTGVTVVYNGQTDPPLTCSGGSFTRTWTATDDFGNFTTYSQDITISADNTDPVITGTPTSITESCEFSNYPAWLGFQRSNFSATDSGCGILSLTDDAPGAYDEDCSSIDITFTATDSCTNAASVTVTYAIVDNNDPFIAPPLSTNITLECDGIPTDPISQILSWEDNLTVSDNCTATGDIIWTNNFTDLTGGCGGNTGTASVEYTAMDQCGNTDMITINFTVNDSNDPDIITGALDTTVICDGAGNTAELADWLTNRGYANAIDFCTDDEDILLDLIVGGDMQTAAMIQDSLNNQLATGCGAFVTVEFAFTDLCGNTSATIADFVVLDTFAPTITISAAQVIVECDNPTVTFATWLETRGGAIATDACTGIDNSATSPHWTTNIISTVPGPCFDESTRTVEFTVTDQCGLSVTTTAAYIVEDNGSPAISPTATSISEECGGGNDQTVLDNWINSFGGAAASDVCSDAEWSEISYTTSVGAVDANIAFGDTLNYPNIVANDCDWSVEVVFTVKDSCDNTSETMATFTITDTTDPVLSGTTATNDTLTINCDAVIPGFPNIVATDNCGAANVVITVDSVEAQLSCLYNFVRIRTWTGTDDCNNTSSISQVLIVQDTTKPFLSGIPLDMTVSCNAVPAIPVLGTDYTANDNCDVNINDGVGFVEVSTRGIDPDSCSFYNYTLTRNWTVIDVCGNGQAYTQVITVQDLAIPTFTVPADTTIDCHVSWLPASTGNATDVLDVCDNDPDVNYMDLVINPPGACPNDYMIRRTWMVEDACGNMAVSQIQLITVQDTLRPEFTMEAVNVDLECTSETTAQDSFINWVADYGNAEATDLCTDDADLEWFAAVPGTYDLNDPATWPGTAPGGLTSSACPSPTPGIYRSETVDFVVYDECEMVIASTATFNVIDTDAPDFDYCPSDDTDTAEAGECFALYTLPAPIISDGCNAMLMYNFPETEAIFSSNPGDDNAIVNTVVIGFSGLPTAPVLATGIVSLVLDFTMLDGEESSEFFNVFGDDGSVLGVSNNTSSQCGDVTTILMIPAATYNAWASDGEVNISLVPNIPTGQPGVFAINDICPNGGGTGGGSSVTGTLSYAANDPNGLVFQYGINGDTLVTVDPIAATTVSLLVGNNDITYYATDCAGNTETCEFTITVEDNEAPVLICPANIDYYLVPGDDCGNIDIELEIPVLVADNCPFDINSQTQPGNNSDALLTFSYNPNYLEYVADDKDFNFVGVAANAVGANATFTVTITGDADDAEEYFTIFDEDGNSLGTTEVGQANVTVTPAACPVPGTTVAVFTVPTATFNMWAADGNVTVAAVSNNTFAVPPSGGADDGINPSCAPFAGGTPDGTTDNVSTIFIELEYQLTDLFYSTTGATDTPLTEMLPPAIAPTVSFELGQTDVTYTVYDNANNEATCSFVVNMLDTIPPVAVCEPTTIFVSPSGVEDYILEFNEIEDDSYDDNCDIVSFTVTPNVFTCLQAEDVVTVTLVAEDESGNLDSCTTIVSVSMELPEPEYAIGLCGDDNLSLFANAPWAPGGTLYTYIWRNPDGTIISNEEDPVITGVDDTDSGFYSVEIEGLTGCTAIGVVNVIISSSPNVPLLTVNSNVLCDNDEITLITQSFSGTNVTYNWYIGIAPNGTLLTTTILPIYTIPAPLATGTASYYVVVELDGCTSDPSGFETITVSPSPVATTNNAVINICEGEDIVLGTAAIGVGYTYFWTGPDGYNESGQTPPVINNASLNASGTYNLIITANGCSSNIATTVVNVTPTPAQPIVSTGGVACQGDNVILVSNNNTANSYTWIAPDFTEIVTATNSLTLTNVTVSQSGNWSLYVTTNGCVSETSSPVSVFVEPTLTVVASNDGPICEGDDVSLLVNSIPGAVYSWTGPAGFISASQNPITTAVAGMYTVTVESSTGCTNTASTSVAVSTAPIITALSNTGAPCVTGADDIMLVPTVFPPDNGTYTYLWDGPNGFISTDVSPVLPNGTSIDNGSYVLVVTNASGCTSNAVTTVVNVSDAPAAPALTGTIALCEGGTITITHEGDPYVGTTVTYTWMTPLGTITTSIPSLTIPNATSASSGLYMALVTVDGCTSLISNELTIDVGAVPPTPVIMTNSPICEGETLELSTALISGAEYIWTGPGNFDGNGGLHNPEVSGVDEDNEGTYQVQVIISGCPSTFSVPVNVEVNETPTPGIAINNGPICKENGATLLLSVTSATAVPGATYTWVNAQLGDTIAGPTTSLNAPVVDFSNFPNNGLYDFYVITNLNGCNSVNSIPTTVEINTAPSNEADAGTDLRVCNGQSVSLSATAPTIGGGSWFQTAGPLVVIVNPNSPTTPLSGLVSGNSYTFLWTLSNGACMGYDSDEVIVNVDSDSEAAFAGTDMNLCNQTSANLTATAAGTGITGVWTQAPAQAALGIIISDPTNANTNITGMEPGNNYSFVWSLSNLGCGEFAADELNIEIEESNVIADAGLDFADCGNGSVELEALVTSFGAGTWSTVNSGLTILEPNNRRTTVEGLVTGIYTFVWTLDNGSCGITLDSIEIDYESVPVAMDDELAVSFAGESTIDVTVNDDTPGGFIIALLTNSVHGVVTNPSGSDFQYTSTSVFVGIDSFSYEICSEVCPDECSSATVLVNVGEDALCTVPTIFTPNEDGVNDDFVIPCLASDRFPGNVVSVFNQWGDQIFRSAPYTNNWKGTYDGQDSPVGTYFYVIEFGNGEAVQSGFIVLER
ncbi:MAG: gliding motility-associated-like protein [Polaribacter sp.]|jgi:gliding motility-associated-like protein